MRSLNEWRRFNENEQAQAVEPTEEDYQFYLQKIKGKTAQLLHNLTGGIQPNDLAKKGFIVQELLQDLNLNVNQVAQLTTNIKQFLQTHQNQPQQQNPNQQPQQQQNFQQQPGQQQQPYPQNQPQVGTNYQS